ncbi:Heterokaryon incompatibility protein 6, OR allele [Lachnellula arida]|uniref:Heterokaryon incompatibility protein 6, OR allele n=1 Tax=Lachnellula arida TaxID=1316785 RepID=A0A8T9B6C5_9HELO|nr:Heterokaryon incompatibility protein 6, OR allele [Lachnellula arida]
MISHKNQALQLVTRDSPPEFHCPPLDPTTDGIRLLILQPGRRGTKIKCGLTAITFGENPTYDALSYEWGDASQLKAIQLNGSRRLVRENLWDALDSLRDEKFPKALWVDFLCIDQNNTAEKNKQIPLMAFIYRRAQQVIIWLGSHQQPVDEQHEQKLGYTKNVDQRGKHTAEMGLEYFMHSLVHEEYWKRAWIIQEVGMASKITVNHRSGSMEWKAFIKLLNWYREQNPNDAATQAILKLDNMRRSKFSQTESFSLQNLVDEFRDAFCELPHDKVYAFIGLANDTMDNEIPVNYQQSESEVYYDMMKHHFDSLHFETQQTSSIEAVYLAALVRRLLTREKIRRPGEIRTLRAAVTKDSTNDYVAPPAQPSQKEVSKDRSDRNRYDDNLYPHRSFETGWSYSSHIARIRSDAKEKPKTKKSKEAEEKEDKDEEETTKKDNSWEKPLFIAIGVVGAAGLAWLIWKLLNPRSTEKLTWCWEESAAEDVTKWTTSADKGAKGFVLRGAIIGKVEHIGPSAFDLTTSHDAEKRWNARLGQYYRGSADLGTARGLNEKLLSILSNTADFRTRDIIPLTLEQSPTSLKELRHKPTPRRQEESPVIFLGTNVTLGVAPGSIREGDFICQFWNSSSCAVLRKTNAGFRPRFQLIGTASIVGREENVDWEVPADKTRFATSGLFNQKVIDLPVSMMTLTLLSLDTVNLPGTTN